MKLTEAEYICFLAKNISKGYYQKGGFYVLPYPEKQNNKAVYFPDLAYSKSFWLKIAKCRNKDLGKAFPKECIHEVSKKLPKTDLKSKQPESAWKAKERRFIATLNILLPNQLKKIKSTKILFTRYGTLGSFNIIGDKIILTHRVDIHPDDIGRKILYCLVMFTTKKKAEIGEVEWYKRRMIVNFLLGNTMLKNIIPNAKASGPKKKELALQKDGQEHLKKLGFWVNGSLIKISQWGKITIAGNDIAKIFTKQEEYIIKILVGNRGQIVGFDEFLKIPSPYALSKAIETIRKKIQNLGINTEIITTVRGKGYTISI